MAKRETYDLPILTKADQPAPITKALGDDGILGGYASKFWEVDSYGECTAPGCFTKSITERGPEGADRIVFRYEHMVTVGKHTSMVEDETGLAIEAFISDDPMDGGRLRRHLKDGVPYGISIGFRRIRSRSATAADPLNIANAPGWLTNPEGQFDPANVIVLEECRLMENSAVSFPAVDSALVDSYRSLSLDTIERLLNDLKAGSIRPEDKRRLEQLAAILPVALAPSPQHKATPEHANSETDLALLELATVSAIYAEWSLQV